MILPLMSLLVISVLHALSACRLPSVLPHGGLSTEQPVTQGLASPRARERRGNRVSKMETQCHFVKESSQLRIITSALFSLLKRNH